MQYFIISNEDELDSNEYPPLILMEGGVYVENISVALIGSNKTVVMSGSTKSGGFVLNEDVNI